MVSPGHVHPLNSSTPYTTVKSGLEEVSEEEQKKHKKDEPSCAAANVAFELFGCHPSNS